MFNFLGAKSQMVSSDQALPGRGAAIPTAATHFVNGRPLQPPYPDGYQEAIFGLGCFWGAERLFWQLEGVWVTAVGYAGGFTPNPTYEEVCSGQTGHAEVVHVVFDPSKISYPALLQKFWEGHDPTQGMRQGNDRGTQYRSLVSVHDAQQRTAAEESREMYARRLAESGFDAITTEIVDWTTFYPAEEYHQQYLAKNPGGYCGLGGTGVSCPVAAVGRG